MERDEKEEDGEGEKVTWREMRKRRMGRGESNMER